jgi:uncharacterized membrane protein YhaH (DUF805 family)
VTWKQILFSFSGRLNRKSYWIAIISLILGFAAAVVIVLSFGENTAQLFNENDNDYAPQGWELAGALFLIVALLVLTYCNFAIAAKRLHDRDKSAWWLLFIVVGGSLFEFATLAGVTAVGTEAEPSTLGNVLIVIGGLISLWFFVELGFFKGSQGPNRFGPDPLGAEAADAGL